MDRQILNFTANEQILTCDNPIRISTNKVNYIEARFDLGQNWSGYDSVRAVWFNDFQCISTVLDSQGVTFVPFEVMKRKGNVKVNLVGSISENDVLTDRLTSYPVVAVVVDCIAQITGANTSPITPSEYEQFVASVRNDADRAEQGASDAETYANNAQGYAQNASESATSAENYASDAEDARDEIRNMSANATTLPSGSDATASYSDGVLSLGIPQGIQGEKGDNGDTGATPNLTIGTVTTLDPSESATATITGTDENPVLNLGLPKGEQGEVSLDELSALLPTDTASGDIASFSDGTDLFPALSVKAQIEPIQSGSGTPSPDNVRPISGHTECVTEVCGKNLAEEFQPYALGTYNGGFVFLLGTEGSSFLFRCIKGQSYHFSSSGTTNRLIWAFYDEHPTAGTATTGSWTDKSYNGVATTTAPLTGWGLMYAKNSADESLVSNSQIELGSTATDYEPYQGNTYTTTLGRTVYGGTLDVVSGELVVDRAMVDLSTLTWLTTSTQTADGSQCHYADVSGMAMDTANTGMISDRFSLASGKYISTMVEGTMIRGGGKIYVATDADTISGQLCYPLATPQTYQLDPQTIDLLLGQNNLWTDCGSVEVTYKADVGLYIDKKLSSNGTRSLSMGLTKSATAEAETETEPSKVEAETKAKETETEEAKTETETETR